MYVICSGAFHVICACVNSRFVADSCLAIYRICVTLKQQTRQFMYVHTSKFPSTCAHTCTPGICWRHWGRCRVTYTHTTSPAFWSQKGGSHRQPGHCPHLDSWRNVHMCLNNHHSDVPGVGDSSCNRSYTACRRACVCVSTMFKWRHCSPVKWWNEQLQACIIK